MFLHWTKVQIKISDLDGLDNMIYFSCMYKQSNWICPKFSPFAPTIEYLLI